MAKTTKHTYAAAGVNIDVATQVKKLIAAQAESTYGPQVLSGVGFFGGLFDFKGYENPVLVSSVDGVGTKLKIAIALGKHDTIGADIVNHCVNDIFTCGADPLFFLDYIAMGKLVPETVEAIVKGLVVACREVNCALIGGETAEMPGIYSGDDYDLAGFIIGAVEKTQIIMGQDIVPGDVLIGLPSSGLHTNGYSLVRQIFEVKDYKKRYEELGRTLGEALLEPHRCYYHQLKPLLPRIKALAHITGGAYSKNMPRVLPKGLMAQIDSRSWTVPPLFHIVQNAGNIDRDEMYHVFNMGIGMVVVCSLGNVNQLVRGLPEATIIGQVLKQTDDKRVIIK